jgi:hypothetical protein
MIRRLAKLVLHFVTHCPAGCATTSTWTNGIDYLSLFVSPLHFILLAHCLVLLCLSPNAWLCWLFLFENSVLLESRIQKRVIFCSVPQTLALQANWSSSTPPTQLMEKIINWYPNMDTTRMEDKPTIIKRLHNSKEKYREAITKGNRSCTNFSLKEQKSLTKTATKWSRQQSNS